MNQLVMFFLGLIIGVVIGVLGSNFSRTSITKYQVEQDFATMEDMFEQFIGELEEKHQSILAEISEQETWLNELFLRFHSKAESMESKITQSERETEYDSFKVRAIKELLNQGCRPETIAKRLGIGKGEVNLLLQLEKLHKNH